MRIFLSVKGRFTVLPINSLYLLSSKLTATAVSPIIVSGLVVATVTYLPLTSDKGYFMYVSLPSNSSYSTSRSESAVRHRGHQLISRLSLYIRPSSYSLTKTSLTALESPSSRVNLSLDQSHEAPSRLSW